MDAIVDELGSFTSVGFYDGSLVWNIVVRASRYCPVNPELAIYVIFVWLWWGSSTTGRNGLNLTKMVVIVNFIHYSVSCTSVLFAVPVLLTPLLASSHLLPKG